MFADFLDRWLEYKYKQATEQTLSKRKLELGLITSNPADKIIFPKQDKFKGDYYTIEEVWALFGKVIGTKMEMPVIP